MSKHLTINDIEPEDYKYVIDKPNKDFSPAKNYATIKKVIEDTDKFFKKLDEVTRKDREMRVDVLSSYSRYAFAGRGEKTLEQYVGKQWMSRIIGERILRKARMLDSIKKQNRQKGNTKFNTFDLL